MDEMEVRRNAYSCSFNGSEVITGKVTIDTISKELLTKLRELRPSPESEDSSPINPSEGNHILHVENGSAQTTSITTDQARRELPVLIFITHSIGSWVVKQLLTYNNNGPTTSIFDTVGMILLDDLDCDGSNSIKVGQFQQYLKAIGPMISLQGKRPAMDLIPLSDLMKHISSINGEFQRLQSGCIEARFKTWTAVPTTESNLEKKAWARRALFQVNNLKRHIVKRTKDRGKILDLSERVDIFQAIGNLLSQSPPGRGLKQPPRLRLRCTECRDDAIYGTSSDADLIAPNSLHNVISRRISFPAKSPNSRPSGFTSPTARSFMLDDERISIGSFPAVILNNTTDENLKGTIDLGKAFLERGELRSAETAFVRCQRFLEHLEHHQKLRYEVEIRVQLAGIKLHRGGYKEAHDEFKTVLSKMNGFSMIEKNIVKRWIAISLLLQGLYEQAVEKFDLLLKTDLSHISLTDEVPIRRDLALASAYKGDYQQALREIIASRDCLERLESQSHDTKKLTPTKSNEIAQPKVSTIKNEIPGNELSEAPSTKAPNECPAKSHHLYLAESKIRYMRGEFEIALAMAEKALHGMKERWGTTHLKTLDCASLHSILLAFNSRISEAEAECNKTLLETRAQLGPRHPQTLETMGYLVKIWLFQARLVEASDTAKSLAKTTESSMTVEHPQTHRCRYLVAETLLATGDYTSADIELRHVIKAYRDCHPDTLCYQSRLALAKYHQGKLQEAGELSIFVLEEQCKIYNISNFKGALPEKSDGGAKSGRPMKTLSEYQETLKDLLNMIKKDAANLWIHPNLLQTLRTIALVAQQSDDLGDLGFRVFSVIWERNRSYLPKPSIFTIDSEYDLALAYREGAESPEVENSLKMAAGHFKTVYRERFSVLGPMHVGTISARRELIITKCALGYWEPPLKLGGTKDIDHVPGKLAAYDEGDCLLDNMKWGLVETESRDIVYQHEGLVGKNHPETLKSLLWLLMVQILLRNEKGADEILQKGLQRLRHKSMRYERFIESLSLEQKFALALLDLGGKYELKALHILREISYAIEDLSEKDRRILQRSIELLKRSVDREISRLSLDVQYHKSEWEVELRSYIELSVGKGSYSEAITYQAELWSLLASLGNRNDEHVLDARIQLAEFKLRSIDYHENKEGLQILEELMTKYSKALTTDQIQRIEEIRKIMDDKVAF
ncbi:hypothetical protein F4680DRAFT_471953, partial [Xylaria scruposa]